MESQCAGSRGFPPKSTGTKVVRCYVLRCLDHRLHFGDNGTEPLKGAMTHMHSKHGLDKAEKATEEFGVMLEDYDDEKMEINNRAIKRMVQEMQGKEEPRGESS